MTLKEILSTIGQPYHQGTSVSSPYISEWIRKGKTLIKEFIDFSNSSKWELYSSKDNLNVYSYMGDHGLICIKGITIMDFTVDQIYEFLQNTEAR